MKKKLLIITATLILGTAGTVLAHYNHKTMTTQKLTTQTVNTNDTASAPSVNQTTPPVNTTADPTPTPTPVATTPTPKQPAPVYGEDPGNKGIYIVFDKTTAMNASGIPSSQQATADQVISQMSSWQYRNDNIGSNNICWGAPADVTSVGNFYSNPITQLKWCQQYVVNNFNGDWAAALASLSAPKGHQG